MIFLRRHWSLLKRTCYGLLSCAVLVVTYVAWGLVVLRPLRNIDCRSQGMVVDQTVHGSVCVTLEDYATRHPEKVIQGAGPLASGLPLARTAGTLTFSHEPPVVTWTLPDPLPSPGACLVVDATRTLRPVASCGCRDD